MRIQEAHIEINREGGSLSSINVTMPVWDKTESDDFLSVSLPLFGGLKTTAKDEFDAQQALKELIILFCKNCEEFGLGLEAELRIIGWSLVSQTSTKSIMDFEIEQNVVFDELLKTGDNISENLQITN
jgi:hypothetical protein